MAKFRKKPVIIDAIQFRGYIEEKGGNYKDVLEFMGIDPIGYVVTTQTLREEVLTVYTLEGDMRASQDDWIIKGVKGEFYPCKPDIFDATYDKAD